MQRKLAVDAVDVVAAAVVVVGITLALLKRPIQEKRELYLVIEGSSFSCLFVRPRK